MYKRIFEQKEFTANQKLEKVLAYYRIKRGARIGWRLRFNKIFRIHPEYKFRVEKNIEKRHEQYWKPLSTRVNPYTLRVCKSISGLSDARIVPEEIFLADIAPTLNRTSLVKLFTFKSLYNLFFPESNFPRAYFHNIEGEWFDSELNPVRFEAIKGIIETLDYPLVIKPNRDSFGGKGVSFPVDKDDLLAKMGIIRDFIVQEKIIQHKFLNKFNVHGLNTIRICLYKSVTDNKIHVLNCALRMGVGGSLDNETAGGIVCFIDENGSLSGVARDKYGRNFHYHPDSNLPFEGVIPDFPGLLESSINLAGRIYYTRLTSLDFCLDYNGQWRPLEINLSGHTIRFSQYAGQPFFGKYTDEVRDYCIQNHWVLKQHPKA